jgi:hypothetical protein
VKARGRKSLPLSPVKAKIGRKETVMTRREKNRDGPPPLRPAGQLFPHQPFQFGPILFKIF